MLSELEKNQFEEILEALGEALDITESQYNAAVRSYNAVGEHLAKEDSLLYPFSPEILPQGSFMLGTMIRPIIPTDDLDIDLVCQLIGKNINWTQLDLKKVVGDQLKRSEIYKNLIDLPDGRRCWTLKYRQDSDDSKSKYHMDILPSIVDHGYRMILEKAFSTSDSKELDQLAIRITDKNRDDYHSESNHLQWLKSNPFGYGNWFYNRASLEIMKAELLMESIAPVPKYKKKKLPLQRIIQILKRHRDIMFQGNDDKPISIIITTLAARAYKKETSIIDGLLNVARTMTQFIEERYSPEHERNVKWIENPINEEENFADKWIENQIKERNFYKWHSKLISDLEEFQGRIGAGLSELQKSFSNSFGEKAVLESFKQYGESVRTKRDSGLLKMTSAGVLSSAGSIPLKAHNFEGNIGK